MDDTQRVGQHPEESDAAPDVTDLLEELETADPSQAPDTAERLAGILTDRLDATTADVASSAGGEGSLR